MLMVVLARYRFLRMIRVEVVLYCVLVRLCGTAWLRILDAAPAGGHPRTFEFGGLRHIPYCGALG